MGDYERLISDLHEMNEHGMRDNVTGPNEAILNARALALYAAQRTNEKAMWKVMMSEPHDPTQRFWIILEGKIPDANPGGS